MAVMDLALFVIPFVHPGLYIQTQAEQQDSAEYGWKSASFHHATLQNTFFAGLLYGHPGKTTNYPAGSEIAERQYESLSHVLHDHPVR